MTELNTETLLANLLSTANSGNSEVYTNLQTTLLTDLSTAPYHDDYNIENNYHRLLFRPGYAVQARELTQMQTMLQDQINRFGKHTFKEGSIVLGGAFSLEPRFSYVKVKDTDDSGDPINIGLYLGQTIRSPATGLEAFIYKVAEGTEANEDTKTIFVRYKNSGSNGEAVFDPNETLVCDQGNLVVLPLNRTPTGVGTIFVVREGVLFAKNHFIGFKTQSVILSRYSSDPTCRVGFVILEDIVRFDRDASLLDPALESSNFSAPGADRLKLTPILTRLDLANNPGPPDYVDLFSIKNGIVQETFERSQYARWGDELAKRTFDESGDYYVRGFTLRLREHLNNGENDGYLTEAQGGMANNLVVGVEPGVAYVKGYEVSTLVTKYLELEKSVAYSNVNGQISSASIGNFFICDEVTGSWTHDTGFMVDLYDTPQNRLSTNLWSSGTGASGNVIGTAKVKAIEHEQGILGTPNGQVRIYLFDIKMNLGEVISDVRSIYNNTNKAVADIVLENGSAYLKDTMEPILIYEIGPSHTKSIRSENGDIDTSFIHKRTKNINIGANGSFTLSVDEPTFEAFPYGISTLGTDEKREIVVNVNENFSISLPGGVEVNTATRIVNANGGNGRFTRLHPGVKLEFTGVTGTYYIESIIDDNQLVLTANPANTVPNTAYQKVYKTGDIIDLTTKGSDAGEVRTVNQISPEDLFIDLKESLGGTRSATVSYRLYHSSAKEIKKNLRSDRYVQINCSTAGVSGPFNLGVSDVFRIKEIRRKTGAFTSASEGVDVTSQFYFDTGQRDEHYDHASISPKLGLTDTDYLLVKFDYFYPDYTDPQSVGYFSVDSYPIDDDDITSTTIQTPEIPFYKSYTTGYLYDLRNCLDFRPVKTNTAADATTVGAASTNPATTNAFYYSGSGYRMPAPSSQVIYDYSYYLARRDLVVVDKDSNFSIIRGTPSSSPITPTAPENVMVIGSIYVSPYPSTAPSYANKLNRADLASFTKKLANIRFTMKDIGVLKNRIENIEYYNSLNSLEKQALDMKILDENGLDRFKNGVFVDSFRDHSLGSVNRPDYKISVDSRETSIRPVYDMNSLYYDVQSSNGVVNNNNLLTLPYTEEMFWEFVPVTTYRNIETSVYRYVGTLELTPDTDVWVDTQTAPDSHVTMGSELEGGNSLETHWNSWQQNVVGYRLINQRTGELIGTYSNEADAVARATDYAGVKLSKSVQRADGSWYHPLGKKPVVSGTGESVIVETVYDNYRQGIETQTSIHSETQELGDRVIDVGIIPNIRPQVIKLHARGLKAQTRYFVYFDGEDMSDYVTPTYTDYSIYRPIMDGTNVTGFDHNNPYVEGEALRSDSNGDVWALLRIPANGKTFRIGTKEVVITDSPVNGDEATSISYGYFVAQGLVQTKQNTILTTRTVINSQTLVEDYNQTATNVVVNPRNTDSCSAYSFFVKAPEGEEGLFLTSVDIWVAAIDANQGCWFEVREMSPDGGITRNQVPLSELWMSSQEIEPYVVSIDDVEELGAAAFDKYLRVKFKAPLFLYNNTQYAFIIHTQGVNPQTYFWMARNGDTDLITGNRITSRPLTGTLFTTNNNLNWNEVVNWDLKCRFNRAVFDTNTAASVVLGVQSYDKPIVDGISQDTRYYGETLSCDKVTLSNVSYGSVVVGDILQSTINVSTINVATNITVTTPTNVNVAVVGNNASAFYLVKPNRERDDDLDEEISWDAPIYLNKYSYIQYNYSDIIKVGKSLRVLNGNGVAKLDGSSNPVTATIGTYTGKKAKLNKFSNLNAERIKAPRDDHREIISYSTPIPSTTVASSGTTTQFAMIPGTFEAHLTKSTGDIEIGDVFYGPRSNTYITIKDLDGFKYSVMDFEPAYLSFNKTIISFEMKTTANGVTPILSSSFTPFDASENYQFNREQVVLSKSQETALLSGNKSNQVKVNMSSRSSYLSPILDLGRTHSIFVRNIINANTSDETAAFGGALHNKYISKIITLAEDQDAEDIKLFVTGYRPTGTDIPVWVKLRHNEDSDILDVKDWVRMVPVGTVYSASSDMNDFIEYNYEFPKEAKDRIRCPSANTTNFGNGAVQIVVGDRIVGHNTGTQYEVTDSRVGNIYVMTGTGYAHESANVYNAGGVLKGNTIITSVGKTIATNAETGIVEYTTDNSEIRFSGYKQYQIKIGLASDNPASVPRAADARVINLQM